MIDVHIIYNEPTDCSNRLAKCVASLEHPDVEITVHRFSTSAPVRQRRSDILTRHDPSRWIMFADPDDYAVQPGYKQYVEHLLTTEENVCWPYEVVVQEGYPERTVVASTPHHLVALRGMWVAPYPPTRRYFTHAVRAGELFPKVAYCWVRHNKATCGYSHGNI